MKIIDITLPISPNMPVWPGDPGVTLELVESMNGGDHVNVSKLSCSVHTGTHVDAPHHFLNNHKTVENIPLDILVGPASVVEFGKNVDQITADVLRGAGIPAGTKRILLKTRNSDIWKQGIEDFKEDFVAITNDGAHWLVETGILLVGIDYLSIAPFKNSDETHQTLLGSDAVILEGIDLHEVPPGEYWLYCLPMKLVGSDGAPARVILVTNE